MGAEVTPTESSETRQSEDTFKDLAETLMTTLAGVLGLYKTHTANHPDDALRILTIGHCEAQIRKARRLLYGVTTDE